MDDYREARDDSVIYSNDLSINCIGDEHLQVFMKIMKRGLALL
jgi:hypothetical protein